jgi:SAM-dependent methyltransferase
MDNCLVLSPVTQQPAKPFSKLDSATIIALYQEKLGIDVSRFFEGQDHIEIYECPQTGYRFFHPFSLAGDGAFYDSKIEKKDYYSAWKKEYQTAFERIQQLTNPVRVLDIGCGFGAFLNRLQEIGVEAKGLEFNKTAFEHCFGSGLDVSMESIESHSQAHADLYDCVTMFQVLEHVVDVKSVVEGALNVLKPGGLLIIAVPNNEPYYAGYHNYAVTNLPPHHMGLWNKGSLFRLADHFSLSPEMLEYDHKLSFAYYLLFRGRFLAAKLFSRPKRLNIIAGAMLSLAVLPIEWLRWLGSESMTFGTLMVVLQKSK